MRTTIEARGACAITASRAAFAALAAFACAIAFALCLSTSTETAWAGGGTALEDIYSGTTKASVIKNPTNAYLNDLYYYSQNNPSKKPTGVKSSNPSVLSVEVKTVKGGTYGTYTVPDSYPLVVHFKKAGTSTVTFKHAGKSHKVKFVVTNYVNPVKSFKVGSQNLTAQLDAKNLTVRSSMFSTVAKKDFNGKISVKPKSGWKLVSIANGITKLKNGKSSANGLYSFQLELKNTKSGLVQSYNISKPFTIPTSSLQAARATS